MVSSIHLPELGLLALEGSEACSCWRSTAEWHMPSHQEQHLVKALLEARWTIQKLCNSSNSSRSRGKPWKSCQSTTIMSCFCHWAPYAGFMDLQACWPRTRLRRFWTGLCPVLCCAGKAAELCLPLFFRWCLWSLKAPWSTANSWS